MGTGQEYQMLQKMLRPRVLSGTIFELNKRSFVKLR